MVLDKYQDMTRVGAGGGAGGLGGERDWLAGGGLVTRDSNEGYPKVRNHGEGPY